MRLSIKDETPECGASEFTLIFPLRANKHAHRANPDTVSLHGCLRKVPIFVMSDSK